MSPVRVTLGRTLGMARHFYSTAFAVAGFLSAAAALMAFNLNGFEGSPVSLPAVWAVSVSPVLPVLAALLGMDVWSDERRSGNVELLLAAPVRERDLTFGKFLGVWFLSLFAVLLSAAVTMAFLACWAPALTRDVPALAFLPAVFALALQSALWCAIAVAASALFRHAAGAACLTIAVLVALPRGLWWVLMAWAPELRQGLDMMPLDAHALDFAMGLVSTGTVLTYAALALLALFVSSKAVAAVRLVGTGAAGLRCSTLFTVALAATLAGSAIALFHRVDFQLDLPVAGASENRFSQRTRDILAGTHGEILVTLFVKRDDPRFRSVSHFLRALANEADAMGGTKLNLRYVDPRWDFEAARRLVADGVAEGSLVFSRGRRQESLVLDTGCDERTCASTILRVNMPPNRRSVYWTAGHGESSFADYDDAFGMSTIARELAAEGYRNETLDLSSDRALPKDCVILIAGAKEAFSAAELSKLDKHLRAGGRLLVLLSDAESGGVAAKLPSWGIRPVAFTATAVRRQDASGVLVSELSGHEISRPLANCRVLLQNPVAFEPSAAAGGGKADLIEFSELASAGGSCVAAVAERGAGAGKDTGVSPMRVVVIGDASFAMNNPLRLRANANRDFFMNCIAYLSGTDALAGSGSESGLLVTGMDDAARRRFFVASVAVFPSAFFILFAGLVALRRRRA